MYISGLKPDSISLVSPNAWLVEPRGVSWADLEGEQGFWYITPLENHKWL